MSSWRPLVLLGPLAVVRVARRACWAGRPAGSRPMLPGGCEWRAAPGRPQWHLAHPGTVLGGSVLLLLPLDLIEDVARERGTQPVLAWLEGATGLLSALVVAFAVVPMVRALFFARTLSPMNVSGCRVALVCVMGFLVLYQVCGASRRRR